MELLALHCWGHIARAPDPGRPHKLAQASVAPIDGHRPRPAAQPGVVMVVPMTTKRGTVSAEAAAVEEEDGWGKRRRRRRRRLRRRSGQVLRRKTERKKGKKEKESRRVVDVA